MVRHYLKKAKILILGVFLISTASLLAIGTASAEKGEEILKKALEAEGMLDFAGTSKTVSYIKPYSFSNEANILYSRRGMCRMEYPGKNVPGIIVINKDNTVLRYDKAKGLIFRSNIDISADSAEAKKRLLFENYRTLLAGEEKIAGRDTYLIEVHSKYPGRPYKQLWIDKSTYAILSSKLFNPDNSLKLVTLFTKVDFDSAVPEAAFNLPPGAKVVDVDEGSKKIPSINEFSKRAGFNIKIPPSLPAGFTLEGIYSYRCRCGVEMAHLRYFDGLTSISIFEGQRKCPRCDEGFSWGTMMKGRGRGRGCSPQNCELIDQRDENLRAFFSGDNRFIIIGAISDADLDMIKDGLSNEKEKLIGTK